MAIVIFDLDGTLVDAIPDIHAAINEVAVARGHAPLDLKQVRSFIGNGVPALVRRCMAAIGVPEADFDIWHDDFMARYGEHVAVLTRPYPGVPAALDALAQAGHRLAICTNKPQHLAAALLEGLGLAQRFDSVIGGDSPFGRKPEPGALLETVRRLGGGPAVMVGDGATDIAAARAAGLPVLFFTGGYGGADAERMQVDARFDDWTALPKLVAAQLG